MIPISSFYLGATPSASISTATFTRPRPQSQPPISTRTPSLPTSPPPQANSTTKPAISSANASTPPAQPSLAEEDEEDDEIEERQTRDRPTSLQPTSRGSHRSRRTGTMDRAFKFPPEPPKSPIPNITINGEPAPASPTSPVARTANIPDDAIKPVELPPPTPAKNRTEHSTGDVSDNEDVGETEEVDLS